jgi:hypothetical protein
VRKQGWDGEDDRKRAKRSGTRPELILFIIIFIIIAPHRITEICELGMKMMMKMMRMARATAKLVPPHRASDRFR